MRLQQQLRLKKACFDHLRKLGWLEKPSHDQIFAPVLLRVILSSDLWIEEQQTTFTKSTSLVVILHVNLWYML